GGLHKRLAALPIPTDPADVQFVSDYLSDHSDAAWLKCQVAAGGLPAARRRLVNDLKASVNDQRSPADCALLARQIHLVGRATADHEQRQAWARELLSVVEGKEMYQVSTG